MLAPAAFATEVVVVQGAASHVHREIEEGINSIIKAKTVVASPEDVPSAYRTRPKLYIAIGPEALDAVEDLGVPVVFAMIINPKALRLDGRPITGIELYISVEEQLTNLSAVLPKAKRVGIIYAPQSTGFMIKLVKEAAAARGLTIVSRAIRSPDEAIMALNAMTGIDVFWMLPDPTVVTSEMVKHLFLLSLERKIPVFALSEKYVKNGALCALGVDPLSLGRQIGVIANRILAGENASSIPVEPIKNGKLYINTVVAARLGLKLPRNILDGAILFEGRK